MSFLKRISTMSLAQIGQALAHGTVKGVNAVLTASPMSVGQAIGKHASAAGSTLKNVGSRVVNTTPQDVANAVRDKVDSVKAVAQLSKKLATMSKEEKEALKNLL